MYIIIGLLIISIVLASMILYTIWSSIRGFEIQEAHASRRNILLRNERLSN